MNTPADKTEREQALDISRSWCVQAPAGSGKTELLTQRILKLLAHCEYPEEVLAFTFTRKAAAEMRNRLLQSLITASSLQQNDIDVLPDHAKETYQLARDVLKQNNLQNWHLLENTHRLRITTIDAFNAYITSQLPIISAFGSQPEISTDMETIFQEAVQETLSYLDGDTPVATHIESLLQHLNNNLPVVQNLLCQLLQNRDQWLSHILRMKDNPQQLRNELDANLAELIEENLYQASVHLQPYGANIMELILFAADNLAEKGDLSLQECEFNNALPDTLVGNRQQWLALANFFLTSTGELRKVVTIRNGFPKPADGKDAHEKILFKEQKALFVELRKTLFENNEIVLLFNRLKMLPNSEYSNKKWQILSSLTSILPFLVAHLNVVLKQKAQVDYVQVSSAALEALGSEDKPTDLAMRLDYKIKHLLVDEFQDTSSLQSNLLEKLTWGWQNDDGRTLFIVGDGMQSCYGFRNANVGLFLAARDNGIGSIKLNSLQLKVNFRSDTNVVEWVNQVFSSAFPAEDDISRGAVSYSKSVAFHNGSSAAGVDTLLWVKDKDTDIDGKQAQVIEAEALVKQCLSLSDSHPESSIAILVRNRSHLREIVPLLRKEGLPWNASGIDSLTSYTEISDLLTLLKALLNLADKTALLALLRTPFVGLSLKDIHQIALRANTEGILLWQVLCQFSTLETLTEDARQRLQRVMPHLIAARLSRHQQPLRDWLENTWIKLGGPSTLKAGTDLAYISTFFATLEDEADHNDILDIHRFEDKTSRIFVTGKHNPEVKLQIMTIHNAKGLEFDFVLVPGLSPSPKSNDKPLLLWKEYLNHSGDNKLLLSLLGKKGEDDDPTYQYLRHEDDIRGKMENTRLLYIAVTRAAKKAYLYGQVQQSKDKLSPPPATSLLYSIWPQIDPLMNLSDLQDTIEFRGLTESSIEEKSIKTSDKASIRIRRLPEQWQHPLQQKIETLEQDEENIKEAREPVEKSHHNLREKKIGDIIHYCLKQNIEQKLDLSSSDVLIQQEQHWFQQLKPACATHSEIESAIEVIKSNLLNCMNHPLASWIFDHSHKESACELALSDYRFSWRQESIIDRTFIDADDTRWIIDYKSSQQKKGQSLDIFCQEQAEIYQKQLTNYAQLFKVMENRPIKTALFFTSIPHWLETSI